MGFSYSDDIKKRSQELRRGMTKEEKRLWYDFLKYLPVTVNRQKMIGSYIVDFYIAKSKTVIELDGTQHAEPEQIDHDRRRDEYLSSLGIKVLRYDNLLIHRNFEGVCGDILLHLGIDRTELLPPKKPF